MSQQYLLPCECGQNITVQTVEAGQQVGCVCGRSVEVPMLRELRRLQPASTTVKPLQQRRAQLPWARVVFVIGMIGFVISALLSLLLFTARIGLALGPTEQEMAQNDSAYVDSLNTEQLLTTWQKLRSEGLGIQAPSELQINRFHHKRSYYTLVRTMVAAGVFAMVAIVAAFCAREPKPT